MTPDFKVLIPSARFSNLEGCVGSILVHDHLPPDRIIVIDDGAQADAPDGFPVTWVSGQKPFVFARNINLGWARVGGLGANVILMNDDARLKTPGGFRAMVEAVNALPSMGVCSAAIEGMIGNPNQHPAGGGMRTDPHVVAFVCVYIPSVTAQRIGFLDERFVSYGGDDMDYCRRVLEARWSLGIFDGCVVSHGEVPSTYRTRPDIVRLFEDGKRLYAEKYPDPC